MLQSSRKPRTGDEYDNQPNLYNIIISGGQETAACRATNSGNTARCGRLKTAVLPGRRAAVALVRPPVTKHVLPGDKTSPGSRRVARTVTFRVSRLGFYVADAYNHGSPTCYQFTSYRLRTGKPNALSPERRVPDSRSQSLSIIR